MPKSRRLGSRGIFSIHKVIRLCPPFGGQGFLTLKFAIRNHMTHASLFSGIGGFDLAAQWMGWENLFHCEWNPFCQTVLKYYWPNATTYTDITKSDFTLWRGRVDILTGGFPCQPFSTAGQRKGTEDNRYLWPQMLRAIRQTSPRYVVGENVDGIFTWSDGMVFETVCADLENEGYEVATYRIPACATGAPHRRDRWWFVAHAQSAGMHRIQGDICQENGRPLSKLLPKFIQSNNGFATHPDLRHRPQTEIRTGRHELANGAELAAHPKSPERQQPRHSRAGRAGFANGATNATHPDGIGQPGQGQYRRPGNTAPHGNRKEHRIEHGHQFQEHWLEAATRLCVLDDGLPGRLDAEALSAKPQHAAGKWRKESLKAAGNAIVPQVAYAIFQAIQHTENLTP